ncbi:MAG TPA: hypothetical protein VFS67_32860 [Polyangiaceae bacterium]|jgi:hypothetical protein|nr:hypothetical protein [Polyangiaceae bacterium]
MTAAGLTLAFAGLAGLLALVVERPLVSQMANAGAFSSVGWMTLQLRRGAHVLQPALGAASAVFVFGVLQIALIPALRQNNAAGQLWLCVLLSSACAFSLAWLGALLASGGRDTMPVLSRVVVARPLQGSDGDAPADGPRSLEGEPADHLRRDDRQPDHRRGEVRGSECLGKLGHARRRHPLAG